MTDEPTLHTAECLLPSKGFTLEMAEAQFRTVMYQAACYLERLEKLGKISGNGHHAAQKLAEHAVRELHDRWK